MVTKMYKFFIVLSLLLITEIALSATCNKNSNNEITSTAACSTDTLQRIVGIYEIGLCETEPSSPTTTSAFSNTNCSVIFQSNSPFIPTETTISSTGSSRLTGKKYRPANGRYRSMYFVMSTDGAIKASVTFSSARSTDGDRTANVYSARETGTKCWTKHGVNYNMRTGNWAGSNRKTPANIVCGSSVSGLGFSYVKQNSLDAGTAKFSQTVTTSAGSYKIFLLDGFSKLANSTVYDGMGDVDKVLVYAPQDISITPSTTGMKLSFKLLDATNVDQLSNAGTNYLYDLAGGGSIKILVDTTEASWRNNF